MAKTKKIEVKKTTRDKAIPKYKTEMVKELAQHMRECNTLLIASTRGLPSSQFHEIKKRLRGRAEIRVAKKSIVMRAIEAAKLDGIIDLEKSVGADVALFFSQIDAFELSVLLTDNQSPTRARAGDIAPEDIRVEPGPTDLLPGPAISELSGVGLKVGVEGGKLAIKVGATIVKAGQPIKENVAGVMAKLGITPMKVGFEPVAAYDSKAKKVYTGIKIDKKAVYEELKESIGKSLGFAVKMNYVSKETIKLFIGKAGREELALEAFVVKNQTNTSTKEGI
ncbi:MAG: 50S ribosomal protein L10 [archaeon]